MIWKPVIRPEGGLVYKDITKAEATYSIQFVEYLSKLLLNFDKPSKQLWQQRLDLALLVPPPERQQARLEQFAAYSASVEYGLRNYNGTEGASALCRLLVRKYGGRSPSALLQIAFLFTLMDKCQPSNEICRIMCRVQDAFLSNVTVTNRGSGYVGEKPPKVTVSTDYEPTATAEAEAVLRETGRVLKVVVIDGGSNFTKPPKVVFRGLERSEDKALVVPEAKAVIVDGRVVEVVVVQRGSGLRTPAVGVEAFHSVELVPREEDSNCSTGGRGMLVMDHEVERVEVTRQGSGYTATYPFKIAIQSPVECGGDANGTAAVLAAKLTPVMPPERAEGKGSGRGGGGVGGGGSANVTEAGRLDAVLTKLLPPSVGVAYDREKGRFSFVEKSALGNDIFTDLGPRRPIVRENSLDLSVYARLAASGAVCASISHGLLVPLDTVKIRMQTAPPGKYASAADAAVTILTKVGGGGGVLVPGWLMLAVLCLGGPCWLSCAWVAHVGCLVCSTGGAS